MTQSREPNDRDLFTRLAQVEYRLSKMEGVADSRYDLPSPRRHLRFRLPSPKLGRGVGGEGKICAFHTSIQQRQMENTQEQLEDTMTPGGYITEAFEQVHQEIDEVKVQIGELNGKIDTILRHITGMSSGNS